MRAMQFYKDLNPLKENLEIYLKRYQTTIEFKEV